MTEPTIVRLVQWEALDDSRRLADIVGPHLGQLVEDLEQIRQRVFGPSASRNGQPVSLLLEALSLAWLPLAFAQPLELVLGEDLRRPNRIRAHARRIVEHFEVSAPPPTPALDEGLAKPAGR